MLGQGGAGPWRSPPPAGVGQGRDQHPGGWPGRAGQTQPLGLADFIFRSVGPGLAPPGRGMLVDGRGHTGPKTSRPAPPRSCLASLPYLNGIVSSAARGQRAACQAP